MNVDAYLEKLYWEWDAEQAKQEEEFERFPRCTECGNTILGDWTYEFNDELICEKCLEKNHRKWTVDYCER